MMTTLGGEDIKNDNANKQPAALVAPLLGALKALESALPPDLRTLCRPLLDAIESQLSSSAIVPQIGSLLGVLSAALGLELAVTAPRGIHLAPPCLLFARGRGTAYLNVHRPYYLVRAPYPVLLAACHLPLTTCQKPVE